ncbi:MAG: tail fiber protein [Ilumatobacteraceae bacterium]
MVTFRAPKTWRRSAGVKATDLNRELRDQIRRLQLEITILQTTTGGSVDPGTILPFPGDTITIPSGWLLCDGRQVAKASYPTLYSVVGTAYGPETGTDFTLPDFQDKMVRGNEIVAAQTIQARGNSMGATTASDSQTTNMAFTGDASNQAIGQAGAHTHGFNMAHRHGNTHQHSGTHNAANHTHGYNSHSHNTGGPSSQRGNGGGNNRTVAQGNHGHNGWSTGFGSANASSQAHSWNSNIDAAQGNSYSTASNVNTAGISNHNHGANSRQHSHALTHSHTLDTLPAYIELNFLVKT